MFNRCLSLFKIFVKKGKRGKRGKKEGKKMGKIT